MVAATPRSVDARSEIRLQGQVDVQFARRAREDLPNSRKVLLRGGVIRPVSLQLCHLQRFVANEAVAAPAHGSLAPAGVGAPGDRSAPRGPRRPARPRACAGVQPTAARSAQSARTPAPMESAMRPKAACATTAAPAAA